MQTLRLHNADRCSEEREGREEREGMNVWREEEYIGTMGLKKKKKKKRHEKRKKCIKAREESQSGERDETKALIKHGHN